ncbi:MAG: alpha-galactosidase [Akkermansia sp.]|nr:alpha-galactosidase [Akkermansia sp.]
MAGGFHFFTRNNQLSLRVSESGKLQFCYLGPRLACADDALIAPPMEWPLVATDFDSRGKWGNHSGEYALHLRYADGTQASDLHLLHHTATEQAADFLLADPLHPELEVQLRLTAYPEEDTFTLSTRLTNRGTGSITLLQAASAALPLQASAYHLCTFRGGWSGENYLQQQSIARGNTLAVGSCTGIKTAQEGTPGFLLSLGAPMQEVGTPCLLGALAWSGNYELSFKHSSYGHLYLRMGHDFAHSPYTLPAGSSMELPAAILVYSHSGAAHASRSLHRYLRRHVIPHGQETRRTLLNSWEGVHFDVHEPALREMMQRTASLGVELFVLDDGWFGKRDDDTSSLGDWAPNPAKLPQGLSALTAHARSCGIDFGLWMEPEMVCPRSNLYDQHPDWAIRLPGITPREERHQLVLDLTNPATGIDHPVRRVLSETPGISYIKWDCNRKISDPGSTHLPPEQQGNLFFDYIRNYYTLMRGLRQDFPHVTFQCCSAGGGRLDCGAAAFHEEFWLSDNTDACDRLRMQWAASFFFPANAIGCHVTACPNCYTGRETSLKFRFDVALAGRLGLELDPRKLTDAEMAEIRERVELAAKLRPITQLGELHRLVSPYEGPDCALLYTHEGQALLLAYTTQRVYTDQCTRIPLRGLNPATRYTLTELAPDSTGTHSPLHEQTLGGDALMATGLPIRWTRPQQSCVILFTPSH